jgi:hypothetical protein
MAEVMDSFDFLPCTAMDDLYFLQHTYITFVINTQNNNFDFIKIKLDSFMVYSVYDIQK